jgi:hypothetical protein
MEKRRPTVPIGLPVSAVILFILGQIFTPVMSAILGAEVVENTLLLLALPFLLTFVGIILTYMTLIWLSASVLNNNIPHRIYRPIEIALIAGIVLGVVGLFQPWTQFLYRLGFHVLLASTVGFIWWSHVIPLRKESPRDYGDTAG